MNKPASIPFPTPKALAQQQSDFTAEGSPPPGTVAGHVPGAASKAKKTVSRLPLNVRGVQTSPMVRKSP